MSAEKCPVCGCVSVVEFGRDWYDCGWSGSDGLEPCGCATRLAIERAAEVERLRAKVAELEAALENSLDPNPPTVLQRGGTTKGVRHDGQEEVV